MTLVWPPCPGDGWEKNPGHQPDKTKGKRVAVVLMSGVSASTAPVTTTAPPGWAADKSRWEISKPLYPFDIAWFRIL